MANIVLTWTDNSDNEDGFHIYRSLDGAAEALLADVGANITTFTDLNTASGTYVYSVSSFNKGGESAHVLSNSVVVPAIPAAPSNVVAALA